MHKLQSVLVTELSEAKQKVLIGRKYAHYKDIDKAYRVLEIAVLESDDTICVIYKAQYGEHIIFVRSLSSWLEQVSWSGQTINRFTLIK